MTMRPASTALHYEKHLSFSKTREASCETYWIPNTDVYIAENGLVIKVELAGIRREDLELSAEDQRLIISGYRPDCCRATNAKCEFLVMEINYGPFESIIEVPGGYDLTGAKAIYQNGFLRIDVPKRNHPRTKPHSVPIDNEGT
jgi:HSP20 family protein